MVYLKEDGSLDIERINNLPVEEYMKVISALSDEQCKYYDTMTPVNEKRPLSQGLVVDYGFDDPRSGVEIKEYLRKMRRELNN